MKKFNYYIPLDSQVITEKNSENILATVKNQIVVEPNVPCKKMMYFENSPTFLNLEMPPGSKTISFYMKAKLDGRDDHYMVMGNRTDHVDKNGVFIKTCGMELYGEKQTGVFVVEFYLGRPYEGTSISGSRGIFDGKLHKICVKVDYENEIFSLYIDDVMEGEEKINFLSSSVEGDNQNKKIRLGGLNQGLQYGWMPGRNYKGYISDIHISNIINYSKLYLNTFNNIYGMKTQ